MTTQAPPTSTAIAKKPDPAAPLIALLERAKGELMRAATKHLNVDRMLRLSVTALRKTPELLECTPVSVLAAVMQATQLGLELDGVLGRAYLVPFNNTKAGKKECQLIIGYKGMIELAHRSGKVQTVEAAAVFEGDEWEYEEGLERKLRHVPKGEDDPKKLTHAYAIVRFTNGGVLFKALTRGQIEKIRARAPGAKKGDSPWNHFYPQMAMKTAIRSIFKFTPASSEDLARAVALDERAAMGVPQELGADVIDMPYVVDDLSPPPPVVLEDAEGEGAPPPAEGPPKTTADLKARARAEQKAKAQKPEQQDASEQPRIKVKDDETGAEVPPAAEDQREWPGELPPEERGSDGPQ